MKFGQRLFDHFFKILIFPHQSRDHFKNVHCSTSSLIFAKFHHSANSRPKKRYCFISMVQIKFAEKLLGLFFKILTFQHHLRDHFKNLDCSTCSLIFANSTIELINGPTNGTALYRWFKSNFDKS